MSTNDNYGQVLQAYALQKHLKGQGHDVRHIVYKQGRGGVKEQIQMLFAHPIKRVCELLNKLCPDRNSEKIKEFAEKNPRHFAEFKEDHISIYEDAYVGAKAIKANPPIADVYITGSDQVWGGEDLWENLEPYYLSFADKNTVKIAYAASFGSSSLSKKKERKLKELLKDFAGISVREQSGVDLCKAIGFPNTIKLIDPTMLLSKEQYMKLLEGQHLDTWDSQRKVLCYFLNFQTGEEIYWNKIKELCENGDTSVRFVLSSGIIKAYDRLGYDNYYSPDIYNWISSMQMADYVITNSFHGLVFCILFHKRFAAVMLRGKTSKMNTRVYSLLEDFGLKARVLTDNNFQQIMSEDIDWNAVDEKLKNSREEASSFLSRLIELVF